MHAKTRTRRRSGRRRMAGLVVGVVVALGLLTPAAVAATTAQAGPVTATAAATAATGWPILRVGSHGADVTTLQYLLRVRRYVTAADGRFGPATREQVVRFQRDFRLRVDGVVGPQTWSALILRADRGDRGDHVKAVQVQLRANGYELVVDGAFGPRTEAAVRRAQRDTGLTVDGIVGPRTWFELVRRTED